MNRTRLALLLLAAGVWACGGDSKTKPDAGTGIDATTGDVDAAVDAEPDGPPGDAAQSFGLTSIFPTAASRTVDTNLTINGFGINGSPAIELVNCDQPSTTYTLAAGAVTSTTIETVLPALAERVQGLYTVNVTNGDGLTGSLQCALRILATPPPTVTLVVPTTAFNGVVGDDINSDTTVNIQGTGFQSVPNVRWVSTTDPATFYDATFVGFISSTELTATVPSETQMMAAGTYHVFVTNPDSLTGQWINGAMPGIFTVTATPPPDITSVDPARIQNGGTCTTLPITIAGTGFQTGATAWYVAPDATTCAGSRRDENDQLLCPFVVDAVNATSITAHLPVCPALGIYPVAVINPDGQADYFFSIEITPSSSGHLNTGPFVIQQSRLVTARWKHAVQFGFDSFSNSIVYAAGGQNAAGGVLGTVESSIFDIFGTPGLFQVTQQYRDASVPREANRLNVPREGLTLQRVGKTLFAIGGTTSRSDVATPVAASRTVELARILSYHEMPAIKRPTQSSTTGLPTGSWYYRVSAVGPWGESLATREVVAINQGGTLRVCWTPPAATGAVSYNVYRSLASDSRVGTSAAIAFEVTDPTNCFDDNGAETLAPAPGNARGIVAAGGTLAAGNYTYRISAVVPLTGGGTHETYAGYATTTQLTDTDVTAGNRAVQLTWDALAATGVTYRVYRRDANGAFRLITGADALPANTFTDTGIAFASGTPRAEVLPLATGSLSKWTAMNVPQLTTAREGLDGVVIRMDPATSNGLVARILVAGGRHGANGAYTYHKTAESLGIFEDGTMETTWSIEGSEFSFARAYYPLLTTQDRNETPFPPPPEEPTDDGDAPPVLKTKRTTWLTTLRSGVVAKVAGNEPVYVLAAMGDDSFTASQNQGRNDYESCLVDQETGRLACGATWIVQTPQDPIATFGHDGVLYFSYLYPFYGVSRETVGTTHTILHVASAIGRYPILALTSIVNGQLLGQRESASTAFQIDRAYYQMTRLLAHIYVVGGYAEAHTDANGNPVPAGPTNTVERHQQ